MSLLVRMGGGSLVLGLIMRLNCGMGELGSELLSFCFMEGMLID